MATTKAQLVTSLTSTYGYSLKSDSSARGFDRQVYLAPSGVAVTVTSTGAAHMIVASTTNRLDPTGATSSIGDLQTVADHLKAIFGK
jgi:hypothetical protein